MKNKLKLLLTVLAFVVSSFQTGPHVLRGRWENVTTDKNGTYRFLAAFHADDTYDGSMNGKAFVTGNYHFSNDTLIFKGDHICSTGSIGIYKVDFITADSIRFELISDSCNIRRQGTDGFAFKRLASKP